MPKLFGRIPRAGFEIRAIEPFRERSMPSSYEAASLDGSRPGVFYLNAADAARRRRGATSPAASSCTRPCPATTSRSACSARSRDLPAFRRFGWYIAFGEGWALYAESLGVELGVYATAATRLGMLGGELFRAARLVVDVGLHERRLDAAAGRSTISAGRAPDNEREVERYMAWPGQALGYKIGQLEDHEPATQGRGARWAPAFDVRAFHDELLRDGAMPLSILEAKMDRWIARSK